MINWNIDNSIGIMLRAMGFHNCPFNNLDSGLFITHSQLLLRVGWNSFELFSFV